MLFCHPRDEIPKKILQTRTKFQGFPFWFQVGQNWPLEGCFTMEKMVGCFTKRPSWDFGGEKRVGKPPPGNDHISPQKMAFWVDDFPIPKVGYVSPLEGTSLLFVSSVFFFKGSPGDSVVTVPKGDDDDSRPDKKQTQPNTNHFLGSWFLGANLSS